MDRQRIREIAIRKLRDAGKVISKCPSTRQLAGRCAEHMGWEKNYGKSKSAAFRLIVNFARGESKPPELAKAKSLPSKPSIPAIPVDGKDFLQSFQWRQVRMIALKKYGARCQCCGATAADGVRINVDHIKPRKLFPALALSVDNLQVLCGACNHGKGNWDQTDWRPQEISANDDSIASHMKSMVEG